MAQRYNTLNKAVFVLDRNKNTSLFVFVYIFLSRLLIQMKVFIKQTVMYTNGLVETPNQMNV